MSEYTEQVALFDYIKQKAITDKRWSLIFAIPNGVWSNAIHIQKQKRAGLSPGVPDILWALAMNPHHGLFIELKVKPRKLTAHQKEWLLKLRAAGYGAELVYGASLGIDLLDCYAAGKYGRL